MWLGSGSWIIEPSPGASISLGISRKRTKQLRKLYCGASSFASKRPLLIGSMSKGCSRSACRNARHLLTDIVCDQARGAEMVEVVVEAFDRADRAISQ